MDKARILQAESIFNELVGQSIDVRPALLDTRCGGDLELRSLVEKMLDHDRSGMGNFLNLPAFLSPETTSDGAPPSAPNQIGGYEILRPIGQGGMGVVYEARQSNPRRSVALKVLRTAMPSREMLARFRHEANILAQLRHPGIAHIYEAAVAEIPIGGGLHTSQPFFAMELVEGRPLKAYAEEKRLDVTQRLTLMVAVCEAVQHAHEKGVIHRDLKSDNILVEGSGQPRILDFGVARLAAAEDEPRTLHTREGEIVGTLAYMSPEQVGGDPAQVDTRSDVYSLGVILYDLLTGCLPHNVRGLSLPEAARRIRDVEPPPPSVHNPELSGEIDWIIFKCLEKDRGQRYHSAQALAEDIQRHLHDEPVVAAPPTRLYRLRKAVRRNKGVVVAGLTILVLLVAAVVGTGYGMLEARKQRDEARVSEAKALRQEEIARSVTRFVTKDFLGAGHPLRHPGDREETIQGAIERASSKLDSGTLTDDPDVEAAFRAITGVMLRSIGRIGDAERHYRRALEIAQSQPDEYKDEILQHLNNLGEIILMKGDLPGATEIFEEAERMIEKDPRLVESDAFPILNFNLGELSKAKGDLDRAEHYYKISIERPVENPLFLGSRGILLNGFCDLKLRQNKLDEAIALAEEAAEILRKDYGEESAPLAFALNEKALALKMKGDIAAAEPLCKEVLEMRRRILPAGHVEIAQSLNNLAAVLRDTQRYAEAEPLFRETLDLARQSLPPGHYQIALIRKNLGNCLMRLKRFEEAEEEVSGAYDQLAATPGLPVDHLRLTAQAMVQLYNEWAKDDPSAGADAKGTAWKSKLAELSPSQPAN